MAKIKGPKKQLGHSCSKLKKRHPQNIKRSRHPQGLEILLKQDEEQEEK